MDQYRVVSFFERKHSSTVQLQPNGTLAKNGPKAFMVTEKSATSLGLTATHKEDNIPLNTDHSGLVKYETRSQEEYSIVKGRLKILVTGAKQEVSKRFEETGSNYEFTSEDQQCLQNLLLSHPGSDRRRIEETKGGLLDDSFRWILETAEYQAWLNDSGSSLLWIKGDAGKGKTMLMIGIVEKLSKLGSSKSPTYFFCQGTDPNLNNATAILRGLIYMLITQHPHLILYLRSRYNTEGQHLFEGPNAFYSLSAVFENLLKDLQKSTVHLLVDALDECKVDLEKLLNLIAKTTSIPSVKAKWIVSSRSLDQAEQIPDFHCQAKQLSLEVHLDCIFRAIGTYINYKVSRLGIISQDQELQEQVRDQLSQKSDGTFLWVALVIEELRKCKFRDDILGALKEIPAGLTRLYTQMIEQIDQKDIYRDICITLLSIAVVAYRPLHLSEICHLIEKKRKEEVETAVGLCGSFLTIRDEYVKTPRHPPQNI
ncbi:NACHT domain-containing protein [Aspergillus terricola var. indicus]